MRSPLGLVALAAWAGLAGGLTNLAAQDKNDTPPFDPKKLVGKWEPTDPNIKVPLTVEFTDKGKMILSVEFGGKTEKIEGDYKFTGDKLELTLRAEGQEQKETLTVIRLTDEEFAAKDSKGKEEVLRRQKPKK